MLGEFEYLVLSSGAALGDAAYGASVRDAIQQTTGRTVSIGALYVTLDRLEAKGLIATHMGEATSQRGGRAKRMIRVTPAGEAAAGEFYRTIQRISQGAAWATEES